MGRRVHLQDAAQEPAKLRFRQAWEYAPIGMGFVSRSGEFSKVNPALCRLLVAAEDTLLASRLDLISHPDDAERASSLPRALLDGVFPDCEWEQRLLRGDGDTIWVRISAAAVRDESGTARHALCHFEDVTHRKEIEQHLTYEATHDPLTALPRRNLVLDHLALALASSRRRGTNVAVLFVDIDHFKRVNDALGHGVGDELLVEIARRIRRAIRKADSPGRYGGDEFVVVCPDLADLHDVVVVAERLRNMLAEPFELRGREVRIGASIGIAVAEADAEPAELVRQADTAAYRAKQRGRNRYEIYDDDLRAVVAARVDTEVAIRDSLHDDRFFVHYQPIVDLPTGATSGFEALARWDRAGHGLQSPSQFLTIAEETGLIIPVGREVLRIACAQAAAWQARGPLFVSVNVSPKQLLAPNLTHDLETIINESGLNARDLWLEMPESLLTADTHDIANRLRELRAFGVQFALDDFGTGYSSLQHLRDLPVGVLKIDGSFVGELGKTDEARAIVGAVISLAHALGMRTVAEEVETVEQHEVLRELGCDFAQGLHYSAPLAAVEAGDLL